MTEKIPGISSGPGKITPLSKSHSVSSPSTGREISSHLSSEVAASADKIQLVAGKMTHSITAPKLEVKAPPQPSESPPEIIRKFLNTNDTQGLINYLTLMDPGKAMEVWEQYYTLEMLECEGDIEAWQNFCEEAKEAPNRLTDMEEKARLRIRDIERGHDPHRIMPLPKEKLTQHQVKEIETAQRELQELKELRKNPDRIEELKLKTLREKKELLQNMDQQLRDIIRQKQSMKKGG